MWGVDTNVLVRYYMADDPVQSPMAQRTLAKHSPFFVPKSVVLELVWVLQSVYAQDRPAVLKILEHLTDLDVAEIEDEDAVRRALAWFAQGLTFDDALHLASSHGCKGFLTFDDRSFARRARKMSAKPDCVLPK